MIIVTGLGRSGTSFTAKVLSEAGARFMGEWFDENIKAGMEYPKVAAINNLLRTGGAYSIDEAISKLGMPEIKSELSEGVIVKDPKFVLTLDFWIKSGINIEHIVYCSRDYKQIFKSSIKSGRGSVGDVKAVFIPTFYGANVYFTFLERMFFKITSDAGIPVTRVHFPESTKDWAEIEKLSFIAGREKLKEAWERCKRPEMVSSGKEKEKSLSAIYAGLARKDREYLSNAATLTDGNSPEGRENSMKRLERAFRIKMVHPVRNFFLKKDKRQA
jgi:hypothetical protein